MKGLAFGEGAIVWKILWKLWQDEIIEVQSQGWCRYEQVVVLLGLAFKISRPLCLKPSQVNISLRKDRDL